MNQIDLSEWEDISEYIICKCRGCNKWVWFQDELEDYPTACHICGLVVTEKGVGSFEKVGMTIQGESYFEVDGELIHEASLDKKTFESL